MVLENIHRNLQGFIKAIILLMVSGLYAQSYIQGPITFNQGDIITYTALDPYNEGIDLNATLWSWYSNSEFNDTTSNTVDIAFTYAEQYNIDVELYDVGGNYIAFDYITVNVVSAEPDTPPNPTVQSSITGSVTLERTGTPPPGVIWYWQSSSSGTSTTAGNGATKIVTSGTVYYIRAYKTSTNFWSLGAGSVSFTIPEIPPVGCVPSDENYIHTITPTAGTTDLGSLSNDQLMESISYYDGLGRPMQSVAVRAGGQQQDIVTHIEYDEYARQAKDYLPYAMASNCGQYQNNALTATNDFYLTAKYESTPNPFSEKHFEASPLNRIFEQGAPGADWAVDKATDTDHTIKFKYAANSAIDAVKVFNVDLSGANPVLSGSTNYIAGELYKIITKDENWQPTQTELKDHTTEEFKNKQGQVILKRTYDLGAEHDTYYVYDNYGNLTFVLPPKMNASTSSLSTITSGLDDLGYQYKYDYRNRLIEKQIPGKEKELIIYDNLDRPVLTQDANLRADDEWLFTKYDVFGRVTYTGIFTTTQTESTLRSLFKNKTSQDNYEEKVSSGTGYQNSYYTNNDDPKTNIEILTINYYDNYTFDKSSLVIPSTTVFGQTIIPAGNKTKGLATGSKVRVLGETHFITTITGYDIKARALYIATENPFLKTKDEVQTKIDFIGKILKSRTKHEYDNHQEIVTLDTFEYDHADRLIHQFQCIGDDALVDNCTTSLTSDLVLSLPNITGNQTATNSITINGPTTIAPGAFMFITDIASAGSEMIVENTYDELGQLTSKKVGNSSVNPLQVVDYAYNVRGWLKKINQDSNTTDNDLFNFSINYNTPTDQTKALFNGNISETLWNSLSINPSGSVISNKYEYTYDALNRITSAIDNTGRYNLETITYDKNGNIMSLTRDGWQDSSNYNNMDVLNYNYFNNETSNKLYKVADTGNSNHGYKDSSTNDQDYWYDPNGNMIKDDNKGITNIEYNYLNLPSKVTIGGQDIDYIYDATGVKLSKEVNGVITAYAGNYIYEDNDLQFFNHPEGYVNTKVTTQGLEMEYVYQYKDHLGNIRLSYSDSNGNGTIEASTEILEEKNYYPFGLVHRGYNNVVNGTAHPYGFGGKEENKELGLEWLDFSARNYDPALGRWMNLDPLAEQMRRHSPYNYAFNNPLVFTDPDGMAPFTDLFDKDGNKLGDDGVDNGVNVVVNNEELAGQVKEAYKKDGTVSLLDDQFSFTGSDITALPSDTALGEALNVLDRTIENGGLSEESSIVYNDGRTVQGSTGDPIQLGVDTEAKASLPSLFPGKTTADVEVSIHSHPTEAKVVGNQVFGGNATVPSGTGADATTFAQYRTNIIVGPLGQATATQGIDSHTGTNATNINKPANGVVIYNNGGTTPSFQFSRRTVNKIIGN